MRRYSVARPTPKARAAADTLPSARARARATAARSALSKPVRSSVRPARAVMAWITVARIDTGPLFRPVSLSDRVLTRRLGPEGIRDIVRHRLVLAGYPPDFASAHGLRSGFLTQAALDGAPLPAAMALSLHRSPAQAQRYYADVEIADNPATTLLG